MDNKNTLAHFDGIDWMEIATGAREKRFRTGALQCRLLEFSPGFVELDWCGKQHVGYVVSGGLQIEFHDAVVSYRTGDGICIPAGSEFKHKAIISRMVTLFLAE